MFSFQFDRRRSKNTFLYYSYFTSYINHFKEGQCIWYGQCGPGNTGGIANCRYDGPPKLLQDQNALKILETSCGMIYNGSNRLNFIRLVNDFLF